MNLGHLKDDRALLRTPISSLDLQFFGSWVHSLYRVVAQELQDSGLPVPPVWISDEWFCPDGVFGVAVPFYLFHPRLKELEEKMIGDAEGGNEQWCLKLLRHEVGHALDNAFNLRRMKGRKELFGDSNKKYPRRYRPDRRSKNYVLHLEDNYAQSHPDEDWAETFAVWLDEYSDWPRLYRRWPVVLDKLLFMDYAMKTVAHRKLPKISKKPVDSLNSLHKTLAQHYHGKKRLYRLPASHNSQSIAM